jgi:ATP-GRASP peptide maturase of grasp-with-spasm system
MILIISHSGGTVNNVIDWICSRGIEVQRLNPYIDKVNIKEIELSDKSTDIELEFEWSQKKIKLSSFSGIWVWHSHLWFNNCDSQVLENEENDAITKIKKSLANHHTILINYFSAFLLYAGYKTIGNYNVQNLNKLEVLLKAKNIGIAIPSTHILSQKKQFEAILKFKTIITKPYHETIYPLYNEIIHQNYTSDVTISSVSNIKEDIYPTLVQEKIDKLFEIRSFFLQGKFYSMAIFSQESEKTQLDFRNYNYENPNRTIPFKLPLKIERKLNSLFKKLNLNSGSIDMIYNNNGEYIFLEINPVGQFGMVSFPCNYYLEKLMMEALC